MLDSTGIEGTKIPSIIGREYKDYYMKEYPQDCQVKRAKREGFSNTGNNRIGPYAFSKKMWPRTVLFQD